MLRFACLGSGSEGNGLLVQVGQTNVLIDCGFMLAEVVYRLQRLGVEAESLSAIVVTHEHADHIGGVARLAARYAIPVYLTFGTLAVVEEKFTQLPIIRGIDPDEAFAVGGIEFLPVPVPHDARQPVQFVCSDGAHKLGLLTDIGTLTTHVENCFSGCDAFILECNHDSDLLAYGDYPAPLKQRIAGKYGHLDNQSAAALLSRIDCSRLQHLFAAHLSQQNNRPVLAQKALSQVINCSPDWIGIADQLHGFTWREIS